MTNETYTAEERDRLKDLVGNSTSAPETVDPILLKLARLAEGRTGADIERIVREARQQARRQKRKLTYVDIVEKLRVPRLDLPKEARWRVAVHEAGHATAFLGTGTGRVHKVSVGTIKGGMTQTEIAAFSVGTQKTMEAMLVCLLAGRQAEILILGAPSGGSGGGSDSDLALATDQALALETSHGFGEERPLIYFPPSQRNQLLGLDPSLAARVSERLEDAAEMATDLLTKNKAFLVTLAHRLMEEDDLDGEEIASMFGAFAGVKPK